MTKQEILDYLDDINYRYNNSMMYDTLSRMLDELVESVKAEAVKKESASNAELVEWIEDQYFHSTTEGHSQEAIVYHNGALKSVVRHINGDD